MTREEKGQKIIDACLAAQRGGSAVRGIGGPDGMMTWTGMSHSQVWDGLNWLRDNATRLGADLIACRREIGTLGTYTYRVGDEQTCREWVHGPDEVHRHGQPTRGGDDDRGCARSRDGYRTRTRPRQLDRMATETDRAIAALVAAI